MKYTLNYCCNYR